MFNTLKNKLHTVLFPNEALRLLQLREEVEGSSRLISWMDEELDSQRDQKIQAQLAVGHARTETQELRTLDTIQKSVIAALNTKLAQKDAESGKWKGAALEMEEELKNSFFEIAELNKVLERTGHLLPSTGNATAPRLALVA